MAADNTPINIIVYGTRDNIGSQCITVNATSRSKEPWSLELSPFNLGPIELYDGHVAKNFENAWQFCKVYPEHVDATGQPTEAYWEWAKAGWADPKARRFPFGKPRIPLYSLWQGRQLGYVEARCVIYAPLYARLIEESVAFGRLRKRYNEATEAGKTLAIFDFDGHNSIAQFGSFEPIIYNEAMKMGHGFVLAMLLAGERPWRVPFDGTKIHKTKVPRLRDDAAYAQRIPIPNKLFLHNLPYTADEAAVRALYPDSVIVSVVMPTYRGQPKGLAIVEFESNDAAQRALELGAIRTVEGREAQVRQASELPPAAAEEGSEEE